MRQRSADLWSGAVASTFSWPPLSPLKDGGIKSWYKGKESHAVETRWSTKL